MLGRHGTGKFTEMDGLAKAQNSNGQKNKPHEDNLPLSHTNGSPCILARLDMITR